MEIIRISVEEMVNIIKETILISEVVMEIMVEEQQIKMEGKMVYLILMEEIQLINKDEILKNNRINYILNSLWNNCFY